MSKYLEPLSKICQPNFLKRSEYFIRLKLDIYYPEYSFAIKVQDIQHEVIFMHYFIFLYMYAKYLF